MSETSLHYSFNMVNWSCLVCITQLFQNGYLKWQPSISLACNLCVYNLELQITIVIYASLVNETSFHYLSNMNDVHVCARITQLFSRWLTGHSFSSALTFICFEPSLHNYNCIVAPSEFDCESIYIFYISHLYLLLHLQLCTFNTLRYLISASFLFIFTSLIQSSFEASAA